MKKDTALHKGLKVFKTLRGNTLNGLSNQEICVRTGLNPCAVTRITGALIDEGLAERRADGRFTLSISVLQMAQQHAIEMQKIQEKISELNQRIAAGSH